MANLDKSAQKNKTILVVEDERSLLDVVKEKLEIDGFNVITARSVEEALPYLEDPEKISVIWLDHYLIGKESGLDLVARLKSGDSKWKNIPIFVVSNTASSNNIRTYIKLGAYKYYTKADYSLKSIIKDIKESIKEREQQPKPN
ncbi:MAG: response regulator [Patescibacteria group bacterium]|nr:response regulator [Patescibacteria group bacterium]